MNKKIKESIRTDLIVKCKGNVCNAGGTIEQNDGLKSVDWYGSEIKISGVVGNYLPIGKCNVYAWFGTFIGSINLSKKDFYPDHSGPAKCVVNIEVKYYFFVLKYKVWISCTRNDNDINCQNIEKKKLIKNKWIFAWNWRKTKSKKKKN